MSVKFSAALRFLRNLADNAEFLFTLARSVDCLSNLTDITRIESSKKCSVFSDIKAVFSYLH
jgi:hypothetical protein